MIGYFDPARGSTRRVERRALPLDREASAASRRCVLIAAAAARSGWIGWSVARRKSRSPGLRPAAAAGLCGVTAPIRAGMRARGDLRFPDGREQRRENRDRQNEICDGSGQHHQSALVKRLEGEGLALLFRLISLHALPVGRAAGIGITEKLDVTAERNPRYFPLSVPLRSCHLTIAGPKPMEKVSTLTPHSAPRVKWPSSWKNTTTVMTNRNAGKSQRHPADQSMQHAKHPKPALFRLRCEATNGRPGDFPRLVHRSR